MRWWGSVIISICSFAFSARADTRVDLDLVGFQSKHFPCSALASATRGKKLAIGFLFNSFNPDTNSQWSCLRRLGPRVRLIRLALINDTCNRAGRSCARHEFLRGINDRDFSRLLDRTGSAPIPSLDRFLLNARDGLFSALHPETACYVSPMLEASSLSRRAAANLVERTRSVFAPRCRIVWNPLSSAPFNSRIRGTYIERHGRSRLSPPCSYTNDGTTLSLSELRTATAHNRRCVFSGAWRWSHNGVKKNSDKFVPPNARKGFPTRAEFSRLIKAVEYRGRGERNWKTTT